MQALEGKVNSYQGGESARPKFDPELSLIVSGLSQEDGENVLDITQRMLSEGLGTEYAVVDAERLKGRGSNPGLVKVQCQTKEGKIEILRLKTKLKDHPDYKKVYLSTAKSHTDPLIELNFKTLLRDIPGGRNYFIAGNGRLIKRQDEWNNERDHHDDQRDPSARWDGRSGNRQSPAHQERAFPGRTYEDGMWPENRNMGRGQPGDWPPPIDSRRSRQQHPNF